MARGNRCEEDVWTNPLTYDLSPPFFLSLDSDKPNDLSFFIYSLHYSFFFLLKQKGLLASLRYCTKCCCCLKEIIICYVKLIKVQVKLGSLLGHVSFHLFDQSLQCRKIEKLDYFPKKIFFFYCVMAQHQKQIWPIYHFYPTPLILFCLRHKI